MNETIGLIGLGDLGQPMARNLLKSGVQLKVYNRTASKAAAIVALGAEAGECPKDVVTPGGIALTIVSDDTALESVVLSEGFLETLGVGGVHLSMSTVSPTLARKLAALQAEHGSVYVEAPIFGRPEAAHARQLWICQAGPEDAKRRVRPILELLSQGVFDFGEEIGAALTVKLAGNFLIISAWQSIQEALSVAKNKGVDPAAVIEMLTSTLFPAPIYQSYGRMIAQDPDQRSTSWIAPKDVGLFKNLAEEVGSRTDLASLLLERLKPANTIRRS
ncbi:NAD(P)-dependent oxidoreductase (plasmid) [Deinococcus sp. KNUC1210]|uniref:NAD(P)-dependent oxidoreductase n=1 Tax=Deinococcus sp. KNUC1210 TaxID=2917691 RepID=UPI001EF033E3|nr:NAD(P)-dependent oxidoreductase [Deinococcus sp. KNUC1210]ULH18311.1 NAD(P)-dependent oxidoreductase [Deinococcus sp. KNUC1210]